MLSAAISDVGVTLSSKPKATSVLISAGIKMAVHPPAGDSAANSSFVTDSDGKHR